MFLPSATRNSLVIALAMLASSVAWADSVVNANQIVTGSLCVGIDCAEGEPFEYDTLRIKAASPVILMDDTSSASGTFPANDWSLGASDGGSGRLPHFFIRDVSSALDVLKVEPSLSGGIALGAGAVLESGVVSIGSPGNERRIRHLADGVADTDAVTLGQFKAFQQDLALNPPAGVAELDQQLSALDSRLTELAAELDKLAQQLSGTSR